MTGKILSDVNKAVLKAFMKKAVGDELTKKEAEKLGVEKEYLDLADDLDVEDIEFDDVFDNKSLQEKFAVMYVAEQDKKPEAKDKEEEKKEQTRVNGKNGAGI